MRGHLDSYIASSVEITDICDLMGLFESAMGEYGFDTSSYVILRKQLQSVDFSVGTIYHNFPPGWSDHYLAGSYYEIDPLINLAPLQSIPYKWSEIRNLVKLSSEQREFLAEFAKFGFPEGLSVPVFDAGGTIAYFGLGTRRSALDLEDTQIREVSYICQQTHLRYLELGGMAKPETVVLSPREREVVYWIAQGKSNSVIAAILKISDHTVDTLVRRCFHKLDTSNRITAALKAVSGGLVRS